MLWTTLWGLSNVRVGTFEFFAARRDTEALTTLTDYVITRHYPEAGDAGKPYQALLRAVVARQAELVAKWMLVGFIHGVMNTDNCSVVGETIDYGPCAFMDNYHPATVYSSIDHRGRYAYGNQPRIALWNLSRLASCLLPLLAQDEDVALVEGQAAIDAFPAHYDKAWREGMGRKLGLQQMRDDDVRLAEDLLEIMASNNADFTLTFRGLCGIADPSAEEKRDAVVRQVFDDPGTFDAWAVRWHRRLADEHQVPALRAAAMRTVNPAYIPRNHLVEEAIKAAVEREDFTPFATLKKVLSAPYEDQPGFERYAQSPRPDQVVHQTFCGT